MVAVLNFLLPVGVNAVSELNGAMKQAPGSWCLNSHVILPSSISLHLPRFGSQLPGPLLLSTPHTSPSPLSRPHSDCCSHQGGGRATAQPRNDSTTGHASGPRRASPLLQFQPWGLKILGGPICCELGQRLQLRYPVWVRWMAGAETVTVRPPACTPLGNWEGLPCTCL